MVSHWGEEKEKLEQQMEKLSKQLDNIKGRTNRQSKSSRDKMSILTNDRQRATTGEYKLETIQEIHDEVGDIDLMSNIMSDDRGYSYRDISPRESIFQAPDPRKPDLVESSLISLPNSELKAGKVRLQAKPIQANSYQNQSPRSNFKSTSEMDWFERNKEEETLNCSYL